jgi:hypothetical protein
MRNRRNTEITDTVSREQFAGHRVCGRRPALASFGGNVLILRRNGASALPALPSNIVHNTAGWAENQKTGFLFVFPEV